MIRFILSFILANSIHSGLQAQQDTTAFVTESADSVRFQRSATELTYYRLNNPELLLQIDTSLNGFYEYLPLLKLHEPHYDLGFTGTANMPLLFQYNRSNTFHLGFRQYEAYFTQPDEMEFYNPPFPFTYLYYVQGIENEQIFRATHSQNIFGKFNFGANYKLISATGPYRNQRANLDDLYFYGKYRSDNRRYNSFAGVIFHDAEHLQNGGLDISNADDALGISLKQILPVNLNSASSEYRRKFFFLRNAYDLGGKYTVQLNDTTTKEIFYPKFRFEHHLEYSTRSYRFFDPLPNPEYSQILISEDSTFDYSAASKLTNRIGMKYLGIVNQTKDTTTYTNFTFEAYARHEYIDVDQMTRDFHYQNIFIEGRAGSNPLKKPIFLYGATASLGVAGYNLGDYRIGADLGYNGEGFKNISTRVVKQLSSPDFVENQFLSNHFYWENDLPKEDLLKADIKYHIPWIDLDISFNHYLLSNYIYWNEFAEPAAAEEILIVNQLSAEHQIEIGKFHLINYIATQFYNREEILHLPNLITRHRFYYENYIFKGNLLLQAGFDIAYTSSFFADKFSPVTGRFYLQNSIEIYPYPVANIFINAQLRQARAFFLVTHINQGLGNDGFFQIPGYPYPERSFKFGLSWMLFN